MASKKRNWHPNGYYHIVMRGNNRQNIFNGNEDIQEYYRILNYVHLKYPYEIYAYCLMTNHSHLLLQSTLVPLGKIMGQINKRYSDYYRKRHNYRGPIYEARYYAKEVMDPIGLLNIGAYIHRNPIETKIPMVKDMQYYPYSSYPYYYSNKTNPHAFLNLSLLPSLLPAGIKKTAKEYAKYCEMWQPVTKKI